MPDVKNPRVHAEILPALAAVVAPTTKILALGSVTAKGTPEAIASVRPHEVRATVRNHLAGKIEQWFSQTEGRGVVFIVNATSTAEARILVGPSAWHCSIRRIVYVWFARVCHGRSV